MEELPVLASKLRGLPLPALHNKRQRLLTTTTTVETDGMRLQSVTEGVDDTYESESEQAYGTQAHDAGYRNCPASLMSLDVPVPLSEIYEEKAKPDRECWGCTNRFDVQRQVGKNPAMDRLVSEYVANKDTMSQEELAKLIARIHERDFYLPAVQRGETPAHWSYEEVLRHIQYHMTDPRSILKNTMCDIQMVGNKLKDSIFVRRDGVVEPDQTKLKMYADVARLQLVYVEKLANMKN